MLRELQFINYPPTAVFSARKYVISRISADVLRARARKHVPSFAAAFDDAR